MCFFFAVVITIAITKDLQYTSRKKCYLLRHERNFITFFNISSILMTLLSFS